MKQTSRLLSQQTVKLVEQDIMEIAQMDKLTDRQKVNNRLDSIGEFDPACRDEVLAACAKDKEVRAYYVGRAG